MSSTPTPKNKPISRAELELLVKKAREMAKAQPRKAAIILTDWLNKPRQLANIREDSRVSIKKKAG